MKVVVLLALVAAATAGAAEPAASAFAWSAPITLVPQAGVQRLRLPDDALAALRNAQADDLRVQNGAGQAVPHALLPVRPAAEPAQTTLRTAPFAVHALTAVPGGKPGAGRVQVQLDGKRIAVDVDGASASKAAAPGVIVDVRHQADALDELELDVSLPPNRPVTFDVFVSRDLQRWRPVAAVATLYRFEGPDAPSERRIVFTTPLAVKDQVLRLVPRESGGVAVRGAAGLRHRRDAAPPDLVRIPLAAPAMIDATAAEWAVPFARPVAALDIAVPGSNTLLPLRVLGRPPGGAPWRVLGSTVVYRLDSSDATQPLQMSPPLAIPAQSPHRLRIERSTGVGDLAAAQLGVTALVEPIDMVFVASGAPPFTLVAGGTAVAAAALPVASLVPGWKPGDADKLPRATVGAGTLRTPAAGSGIAGLVQRASDPVPRERLLWAVLLLGVAVLGALAWVLLRQMRKR